MNFKRTNLGAKLVITGLGLLSIGFLLVIVKLLMWLAWFMAIPVLFVGLLLLIVGRIMGRVRNR